VTGKKFDFRKKSEVTYSEFIPAKCDNRTHDLKSLKNLFEQVEKSEKRCDATLGREFECGLPNELTRKQQIELAQNFVSRVRKEVKAENAFFDLSIHDKPGNTHLHIAMSEREMMPDGSLAKTKNRDWHEPYFVEKIRMAWEIETNLALEKAGIAQRVDRRTLGAQGAERIPTLHEGKSRHIEEGERKIMNNKIIAKNALLTAPAVAPDEDLSQVYGTAEEYGIVENADPDPTKSQYQYRLAQQQYEGFDIYGLTYCRMNNPSYVILWFDKAKIVDHGDHITANGKSAKDNGMRVIKLAQLKKWRCVKLSGSIGFVEAAMLSAHQAGLNVEPLDEAQRELWARIQATAIAVSSTEVNAINSDTATVPLSLSAIGAKLGNRTSEPAPPELPQRGRGLGL
jgi:hypothetical protein